MVQANLFWSCQIWNQKCFLIFHLQSALDFEFFEVGGAGHQLFLVTPNLRSKSFRNFFIYRVLWTLNLTGSRHQLFLGIQNLRSKSFQNIFLYKALWTLKFSGRGLVQAPTFFGHAKFEVKKFSELFHLQSALDSEFFGGGVWVPTFSGRGLVWTPMFFGHPKFEVEKFSMFFPLPSTLDSEYFWVGDVSVNQLFWSYQIWGQKFFRIFSISKCSGLNFSEGWSELTFFDHT